MIKTLSNLFTWLHRDEGGFLGNILQGLVGGLFGGGSGGGGQPDYSSQMQQQIDLMKERQKYGMGRQAQLDPLFSELLRRTMVRSRMAPMIGGLKRPAFAAVETPADRLPELPPPQLLGSAVPAPGAGVTAPGGERTLFEQFLRERGLEGGGML